MKTAMLLAAIGVLGLAIPVAANATARKPHPAVPGGVVSSVAPALPTNPAHPVPFGSTCFTPLGRIGPVGVAPIGAPCSGTSAQGPVAGTTVE